MQLATNVAETLSNDLTKYATDPSDQRRGEHLLNLCESAGTIRDLINRHPSEWKFDPHGGHDIVFPSVRRDGEEFLLALLDGSQQGE